MGDSTSLFDFVLPNAWGGGKGSCEGAVKRTWRSKNKGMEKCTADRQLQRHEDNNGWTHPRWSQLFFLKLSLGSKETSDLQDPEMHSMLGWAMVRVAKRDGEWRRSPFNILGQDMKIWVCYLLKAICCLTHSKRRLSLCRRCRTHSISGNKVYMRIQAVGSSPPSNFWISLPVLTTFKRGVDASKIMLLLICFSLNRKKKIHQLHKKEGNPTKHLWRGKQKRNVSISSRWPLTDWQITLPLSPTHVGHVGQNDYEP